jgi:maleate isomerase
MTIENIELTQFETVSGRTQFDDGPGRYRIGLVALSNDYVTELDFMNMRPSKDVVVYTSRVPNTPDCTVETLQKMAAHITQAASLIVPEGRLDVMAYSCTSGTAVMGFDKIRSLIHAARPGIACVTPITSSLAALDKFNAQKIAVLTPYVDDVNADIAKYIERSGKTISAFTSFKIASNEEMAKIAPESIYQAALAADRDDADALFISCTAIRAVDVIHQIEQKLGKPVVTAVQAMYWQALRLSGYNEKIIGFGQLFSV